MRREFIKTKVGSWARTGKNEKGEEKINGDRGGGATITPWDRPMTKIPDPPKKKHTGAKTP